MKLILGDCLDKLKELDDNSVDSIVTDPPYGLSFMGKTWDYDVPSQEIWEECMRVLKPGGHLLAFAGSRTYHRMAVRIEDAGFEIRDQIMWVYGSGFPKSMDISKQIDKKAGAEREVIGTKGLNSFKGTKMRNHYGDYNKSFDEVNKLTAPATDDAKKWNGWGTTLKPAHEPIVMARKPLSEKTVADNVLEWGTGGINIDDSRIGLSEGDDPRLGGKGSWSSNKAGKNIYEGGWAGKETSSSELGRFPANVIFDEEAGKILDEQSGLDRGQKGVVSGNEPSHTKKNAIYGDYSMVEGKYREPMDSGGGASRFFYCPKTSKTDRNEGIGERNTHPTVKPTDLMLYLIRLVTPKRGTTLDPFMGSGSTGKGAVRGGFDFIGIEREEEYFEIAQARIDYEQKNPYIEETGKRVETNENAQKFWQ